MPPYVSLYDVTKKEAMQPIHDCKVNPTEVTQEEHVPGSYWIYARNNKYKDDDIDYEKVGKWMLFVEPAQVNEVWTQVKDAISKGKLWNAKVSTVNPSQRTHAVMIYTKDYTDIDDVIKVLEFLEKSGLKTSSRSIKYKTDQQTRAGVYSGGSKRPWIYSSDTIRNKRRR